MPFADELHKRILILDGAMGTMIQASGRQEPDSERLNLTDPELILSIHNAYIAAGADIIEANSFGANSLTQAEFGLEDRAAEMAYEAARIARKAADSAGRKVWVAGSVSPTGKSLTLPSDASDPSYREIGFEEMKAVFQEQIKALSDGGVDFLLFETCFDALNAKAAIAAKEEVCPELPAVISVTVSDRSGRTLTGQTTESFYRAVRHCSGLAAFGINCALGAAQMASMVREIASFSDLPLIFYPNAGLPDGLGHFPDGPCETAHVVRKLAEEGLINIAGGCCGTTPDHIRELAESLKDLTPRARRERDRDLYASGLESVRFNREMNFVNIGERTNVTGSRKFARLISEKKYEEAISVAAAQIEGGASVIDINMDDPMLDSTAEMRNFLRYAACEPAVAKAAVMIDSSNWETVLEGLRNIQGKGIVNSVSLKDGEEEFIHKAKTIRQMGAAMVVMAFDEEGQAETLERKIEICRRSYNILIGKAGVEPQDIIFDPNIFAVGTGIPEHARFGIDYIEAVRWIKENLPYARTSGGVSNVSFAFRGQNTIREAMHSVFLYHSIGAGLDMAIVNPQMLRVYDDIEPLLREAVEDVILDSSPSATERLVAIAEAAVAARSEARSKDTCSLQPGNSGFAGMAAAEACSKDTCSLQPGNSGFAEMAAAEQYPSSLTASSRQGKPGTTPSAAEKLTAAIVNGRTEGLEALTLAAMEETGSAVGVIEGPLMSGMERVGELFADGRMFLPQVVKSARIMKDAVSVLQPYMGDEGSPDSGSRRPRYLIATVNGDVHDIGKNITAIVLRCSGFEVIDLGVMVPDDVLLDKAEEIGADMIGVCGLISPSLRRMEEICKEMSARGMTRALFVGGAATSDLHTAVRLRPLYHSVFHTSDASSAAVAAKKWMADREAFAASEAARYGSIAALHEASTSTASSCEEACSEDTCSLQPENSGFAEMAASEQYPSSPTASLQQVDIPLRLLGAAELMPYADWRLFFTACGAPALAKDMGCPEAMSLKDEAMRIIERVKPQTSVCARFFNCRRDGDVLRCDAGPALPMLRGSKGSITDFFPTEGKAPLGIFAVSVNGSVDSSDIVGHAVRAMLAEAGSEWIGAQVEPALREAAGKPLKVIRPGIGLACCPDHSLKRDILGLLPDGIGIQLTDSFAMIPEASICGLIIASGNAGYEAIGHISEGNLAAYATARGIDVEEICKYITGLYL